MQINSISAGYPDPAASARRSEAIEATDGQSPEAGRLEALSPVGSAPALVEILSRYDVTDISPMEFSEMIQKLFEAGAISDKELQELAAIRLDLDLQDLEADESVDLLEFYVEKIQKLQRELDDSDSPAARRQQLGPVLHRLDWIEKFALIQSAPDAIGLSAVA